MAFDRAASRVKHNLYPVYRTLYFAMGSKGSPAATIGHILPTLREAAARARKDS